MREISLRMNIVSQNPAKNKYTSHSLTIFSQEINQKFKTIRYIFSKIILL